MGFLKCIRARVDAASVPRAVTGRLALTVAVLAFGLAGSTAFAPAWAADTAEGPTADGERGAIVSHLGTAAGTYHGCS